jgi:hypothetical protein
MAAWNNGLKPLASPFYAPPYIPEWHCRGFRRLSVMCQVRPEVIDQLLANTPFRATGSKIEFFTDDMSGHTLGSFNESGILVPVEYQGVLGLFHPVIFITTDVGMIAGREVFGYPKLLGQVTFEEQGDRYLGTTTRFGEEVFRIDLKPEGKRVDLTSLTTLSDAWDKEEYEWTHHLLVKSIPSPYKDQPDVFSVIYRNLAATLTCIQPSTGTISIGAAKEVYATRGAEIVAAYYLEGDFGAGFNEDRRTLDSL